MKKTTQNEFTKRIAKYSALSLAIAGVADASGQIIYTDLDPDFVGNDTNIGLDLNNDGNFDFVIYDIPAPAVGVIAYDSVVGNSFLGSSPYYIYPFALNSGDVISAGQTEWFGGTNQGTMNYVSCYNGIGGSNWCGVTDKYLGLRFTLNGNVHYGWARLDVSLDAADYTLKDYAYNSTPDEPINAGQQSLSIDENQLTNIKITALNKTIALFNLPETTDYILYTMTGKSVQNGKITSDTHVIEANTLATGVYIIELSDSNSNAVIRKKIVL